MMTEKLNGASLEKVRQLQRWVEELLSTDYRLEADVSIDGEIAALAGVRQFAARIKCAVLPWQALANALQNTEHQRSKVEH